MRFFVANMMGNDFKPHVQSKWQIEQFRFVEIINPIIEA